MAIKCTTGSLNKVCTYLLTYTYLLLLLWPPVIIIIIIIIIIITIINII